MKKKNFEIRREFMAHHKPLALSSVPGYSTNLLEV